MRERQEEMVFLTVPLIFKRWHESCVRISIMTTLGLDAADARQSHPMRLKAV